jgi:Leucine-rich repeat (LRR) protein
MSNTQRTPSNLPGNIDALTRLTDVDLSANDLPKVPDCLFTVTTIRRLNLADNAIKDLSIAIGKLIEGF